MERPLEHTIQEAQRITEAAAAAGVSPADLLLSQMQIYELNQKDVVDTVALLLDHPIADHDGDVINAAYLSRLMGEDWGLYRTFEVNTERIRAALPGLNVRQDLV